MAASSSPKRRSPTWSFGGFLSGSAARRLGRDVKAVHGDITALLAAGLIDRTESGAVVFPFDAVKVECLLEAA